MSGSLLALRNKPVAPEYLPPEQRPYPAYGALDPGTPIARDFGPALISPATAPLFAMKRLMTAYWKVSRSICIAARSRTCPKPHPSPS